jgi:hypothetical protein
MGNAGSLVFATNEFTFGNAIFGFFLYGAVVWFMSRSSSHFDHVLEEKGLVIASIGGGSGSFAYRVATWFLMSILASGILFWWILPFKEVVAHWFTFGFLLGGLSFTGLSYHAYYESAAQNFGILLGVLGYISIVAAFIANLTQLGQLRRGTTTEVLLIDGVNTTVTAEGICKGFAPDDVQFVCFPYALLIASNALFLVYLLADLIYLWMAREKIGKDQEEALLKTE